MDGAHTAVISSAGKSVYATGAVFQMAASENARPALSVLGNDVMIDGLTVIGNGTANGIELRGCVGFDGKNITVKDCVEGIYIGKNGSHPCTDVILDNVVCDSNARHGLAITHCSGALISNGVFSNSRADFPGYGIDVEPNAGETCERLTFNNCEAFGNMRTGLVLTGQAGTIRNIEWLNGNTHDNDQDGIRLYNAHDVLLTGQSSNNARDNVRIEGGSTGIDNQIG